MHEIDVIIFILYMLAMLLVGVYFHRRNRGTDDYYVGGRNMGSMHIALSVVATDVGGGFSIGLGGLGFSMGLSGSWMLFTGLLGAWLAAVFLVPYVREHKAFAHFQTFPQLFAHYYGARVALIAGFISLIGYIGFTSSQLLAGAKLASVSLEGINLNQALWLMGAVAVVYTVFGGLKAVIYTDTVQWIILLVGLILVAIPVAWTQLGGFEAMQTYLAPEMLSLTHIGWADLVSWAVTIIPIWFVGMTLYQRIYASRDAKTAKRAWFFAGLLEWPLMAFMGVVLGMLARVAAEQGLLGTVGDAESGLPMLLKTILPAGLMGLVLSSYFSAILSTADSCLMAASGNLSTDILPKLLKGKSEQFQLRISQVFTMSIGLLAIFLAGTMTEVLDLMLYSYAFMVSGLFVPLLAALYGKSRNSLAAAVAMVGGGLCTVSLQLAEQYKLIQKLPWELDANVFGLSLSALLFFTIKNVTHDVNTIKS
ncbi:MAG: sodium:solute symporter family protein [Bacteroidetes bacterium]|nr:MAG: sodium:solute symporter family protein [Bacteroidota bacterium]